MPRRLLRFLPPRPRAFVERNVSTIGYLLLVGYVTVVGAFAIQAVNDEGRERDQAIRQAGRLAFRQIELSRVEQSREGCRRTNRKILTVLRQEVQQDITDLRRVPAGELERFGFTRKELEARNADRLRLTRPVDCGRLAERVARSSPNFSP